MVLIFSQIPNSRDKHCLITIVNQIDKSQSLTLLRMRPVPTAVGMGDTGPYFWVQGCAMDDVTAKEISKRQHTAFTAESGSQS